MSKCDHKCAEGQKEKLQLAVRSGRDVTIQLAHTNLNGDHIFALTATQINNILKWNMVDNQNVNTQLQYNRTVECGLLHRRKIFGNKGIAAPTTCALSSIVFEVGSWIAFKVTKTISGSGVTYMKQGEMWCKMVHVAAGIGIVSTVLPIRVAIAMEGLR